MIARFVFFRNTYLYHFKIASESGAVPARPPQTAAAQPEERRLRVTAMGSATGWGFTKVSPESLLNLNDLGAGYRPVCDRAANTKISLP